MHQQTKKAASNFVWVDKNNIIHVVYKGGQTKKTVTEVHDVLFPTIAKLQKVTPKIKILVDLSQVTYADSGARLLTKGFLTQPRYDYLALIGNRYLQPLIFFVLRTTKLNAEVHYFNKEKKALKWLHDPALYKPSKNSLQQQSKSGWILLPILLLTLTGTFGSWQQAQARLDSHAQSLFDTEVSHNEEAVKERLQTYTDALYGFRGLFHSSEHVNEKEFQDYYTALGLEKNYPGFNGIAYISRVSQANQNAFINQVRNDKSSRPEGRPAFSIKSEGARAEYFVVTYSGTVLNTPNDGIDLGVSEERKKAFDHALTSGEPVATESINLIGEESTKGFLLTIPVYEHSIPNSVEARRNALQGYVNAIFDYKKLFNDTLKDTTSKDVTITISDATGEQIYQHGSRPSDRRSASIPITIAGQTWTMQITAPQLFNISRTEALLPRLIAIGGLLLSIFLMIIFLLQNRARRQAIKIAEAMTEDLQTERNTAIENKNKNEAILSSIGDGVFALDKQGKIILFNKAAATLTGYSAEEAVGKSYRKILNFRDATGEIMQDDFIHEAQSGKQSSMARHTVVVQKDGQLLSVADSAAPIFDSKNNQQGVIVVFRDIATEEKFERAIQAANERFEMIAKATNDAVFDLDIKSGIILWNEALQSEYGYSKKENASTLEWWISHIHPEDTLRIEEELNMLIKSRRKTWENEYRFQKADGKYAFVRARSFVQRDKHGEPVRLISSMLDITKQKELDRAKDEFISLVSHQLRTPLTAIRLFTEMLVQGQVGKLTKEQQDYLNKVDISTKRMIQLVGDILNISRIELGRLKIEPTPTNINDLIKSHIEEVEPLALKKKVKITFKKTAGLPLISIDTILFGQIIHNFLTNAIRYSRPTNGKVTVSFKREKNTYELAVTDNGIGIPTADQARIFERFFRAENAIKVEGEGTGLGLYLIKLVAQSSGGSVRFESAEGKGTTFYISIPLNGMNAKRGDKSLT